ncbi:MAG: DUF4199 domain-containing protein [Gemmatimonadaceae bacterium]
MSAILVITIPFQKSIESQGAGMLIGYASMVAASLLIYFGVRRYRDSIAGGSVSFGRAFTVGLSIAMIAGLCYTATWEVLYFGFDTDFLSKYEAQQIEKARAAGATAAELEVKKAEAEKFTRMYDNPIINSAYTFMEPLPVSLLGALISAGLLRRRGKRREGAELVGAT